MKLNSTYRAALLQILSDERNQKISLQTGYFHGEPVFRIHYVSQGVHCVRTVRITEHAKKLGWKRCDDAPFPNDTWHNPNHRDCQDGQTIMFDQLLDIIQD